MNKTNRVLLAGAALCAAIAAQAQVYKYIDKDGKVQYTDRPPDDAKKTEIKVDPASDPSKVRKDDDWRAKDKDVDRKLIEKRKLQDDCIKARDFLDRFRKWQEANPKARYYENGVLITPEIV